MRGNHSIASISLCVCLGALGCSSSSAADGGDASVDAGGVDASDGARPGDASDPFDAAATCTSGTTWTQGTTANPDMQPGVACGACHVAGGTAARFPFDVAGTVYPTGHEPDNCYGAGGATVVITDAKGQQHSLAVTDDGNFYNLLDGGTSPVAVPYSAKVVMAGRERAMMTQQTNTDCNSCHTQYGTNNALGRIVTP